MVSANVRQLCDGAAIANRQLSFAVKLNRITEVELDCQPHYCKTAC